MRTVVGWDGSAPAAEAVRWAAERAQLRGGTVHVLRVLTGAARGAGTAVSAARTQLQDLAAELTRTHPDLLVTAELAVGDPVHELTRVADRTALLVIGASRTDRTRRPGARRVPVAVVGRQEGVTAVVPADAPAHGHGVVAVVRGRPGSAGTLAVAARAAADRGEPLTLLRIQDPYEPVDGAEPVTLEPELRALNHTFPGLAVRIDPRWVRGPIGLLPYSDHASLLVLEGRRPTSAPPRYSVERWLAGHARAPFVVVAEPLVIDGERSAAHRPSLASVG